MEIPVAIARERVNSVTSEYLVQFGKLALLVLRNSHPAPRHASGSETDFPREAMHP